MTNFTDLQIKRRSIYTLGKDVELSNQELIDTIQGAVLNTPTAFNSQTSRVVILLDEESDAFWNDIAYSELEKVTPAEAFEGTKERLKGFAQAPFGQIVAPAGDKDIQTEGRFKVFGDK